MLLENYAPTSVAPGGTAGQVLAKTSNGVAWQEPPAGSSAQSLLGGMTEWWCYPVAIFETTPYPRTIKGSISSTGEVIASEFNHVTNKTMRVEVAQAVVDDHNAPAIGYAGPGRRLLFMWQNHSAEQFFHAHTSSRSANILSLGRAPDQNITVAGGAYYTQIMHIPSLSNAAQDTFYLLCRVHMTGDIGYNLSGMAYPQPCLDDVVLIARKNNATGVSTIEEWRLEGEPATWTGTTLVSGTTPRPARPYGVLNGGSRALYNDVKRYGASDFTTYEADLKLT